MSAPVDVLAVMREATQQVWRAENAKPSVSTGQCDDARAAVAEMIKALQSVKQWNDVSGLDDEWPLVMNEVDAALARVQP